MRRPALISIASLLFAVFTWSLASAQETPPPAPPGGETAAPPEGAAVPPDAPPPPPLPPPVPPPTSEPGAPPIEERVAGLETKVDGLADSVAQTQSTVDSLSKIKVSGYVQGQYEWHDDARPGLKADNTPAETTRFRVRRARLKTLYSGHNAEYMLQIDAIGGSLGPNARDGVTLKDAEATLVDTWTPLGLRLTVGQFKWPFGYEVQQSSGDREMPERSLAENTLFPGERDRGVRLTGNYDWLRFAAALVNGVPGTTDALYTTFDQSSFKDVVGRVGADFGFLVFGASGYFGRTRTTTVGTATTPTSYLRYRRARLGADAQLYLDVPSLGGFALKAEFYWAKDSNLSYLSTPADVCLNKASRGWYVTAVQNVGEYLGAVLRVDQFDPNTGVADGCEATPAGLTIVNNAAADRVTTIGGGLLLYVSANLKATFVYEHLIEQKTTAVNRQVDNDVFTARMQAKF
jgi:hypothetical protein